MVDDGLHTQAPELQAAAGSSCKLQRIENVLQVEVNVGLQAAARGGAGARELPASACLSSWERSPRRGERATSLLTSGSPCSTTTARAGRRSRRTSNWSLPSSGPVGWCERGRNGRPTRSWLPPLTLAAMQGFLRWACRASGAGGRVDHDRLATPPFSGPAPHSPRGRCASFSTSSFPGSRLGCTSIMTTPSGRWPTTGNPASASSTRHSMKRPGVAGPW